MPQTPSPEDLARSAALLRPCRVDESDPAWQAAAADGWDMSLVMLELSQTAEQRLYSHELALQQALEMREAFQTQYGRTDVAH